MELKLEVEELELKRDVWQVSSNLWKFDNIRMQCRVFYCTCYVIDYGMDIW